MSSFVRGKLTAEQQKRIDDNRRKAMERLKSKGLTYKNIPPPSVNNDVAPAAAITREPSLTTHISQIKYSSSSSNESPNRQTTVGETPATKKPRVELTAEQKAIIEQNRQKALERFRARQENNRDGANKSLIDKTIETRLSGSPSKQPPAPKLAKRPLESIRPSIKKSDYIEYDFSTMTDTRGGFISEEKEIEAEQKTLEEWKEEQKAYEPAPPLDPATAPKCFECQSIELDMKLYQIFKCRVCRHCREKFPEKYSLLTKTECREDYFLTDPELKDTGLLARMEKPNPYGGTYSRMQLFLRFQVEEYAIKKWGSEEALDKEWERRESQRVSRRDKKYELKLKEMRKKTRAEEYTRRLRESNMPHVHEWSQPIELQGGEEGMVKRRCIDCGMETEEFLM